MWLTVRISKDTYNPFSLGIADVRYPQIWSTLQDSTAFWFINSSSSISKNIKWWITRGTAEGFWIVTMYWWVLEQGLKGSNFWMTSNCCWFNRATGWLLRLASWTSLLEVLERRHLFIKAWYSISVRYMFDSTTGSTLRWHLGRTLLWAPSQGWHRSKQLHVQAEQIFGTSCGQCRTKTPTWEACKHKNRKS